jgi:hypothetical protein
MVLRFPVKDAVIGVFAHGALSQQPRRRLPGADGRRRRRRRRRRYFRPHEPRGGAQQRRRLRPLGMVALQVAHLKSRSKYVENEILFQDLAMPPALYSRRLWDFNYESCFVNLNSSPNQQIPAHCTLGQATPSLESWGSLLRDRLQRRWMEDEDQADGRGD